jgi:DNA-binding GntR family transcriptional regulator
MPRDPQRTARWVSSDLRRRIEADEWLAGQQLPTLQEISEHYSVSVTTARKAVGALAEAGLVEVIHGYGVFRSQEETGSK